MRRGIWARWTDGLAALGMWLALLAPAAALAGPAFQMGFSVHLEPGKTPADVLAAADRESGANSFRTDVHWWDIERTKGVLSVGPELTNLEQAVTELASAGGKPLLILNYGNGFYDNGSFPVSEEAQAAFVRYAEFVAQRFRGRVHHFEVWNEWNIGLATGKPVPYTYPGSARDYARLVKRVYTALKRIDPENVVLAGALANRDLPWLRDVVTYAVGYYDGISVHPYNWGQSGADATPEEAIGWIGRLWESLPAASGLTRTPIYVTEMGWPTHAGKGGVTLELQAAYAARLFLLARSHPGIAGLWWYDFADDGREPGNAEHHFGVVGNHFVPKPAFAALKNALALTAPLVSESVGANVVLVRAADGTLAFWSRDNRARSVKIIAGAAARIEVGGTPMMLSAGAVRVTSVGAQPVLVRGETSAIRLREVRP